MPTEANDLQLKIEADQLAVLGRKLLDKIASARSGMRPMLDDIQRLRNLYESKLKPKTFPWPDCSNTNVPVIQYHVDTLQAHIIDVMLGVVPHVLVKVPPGGGEEHKAKAVALENYLQHVMGRVMRIADDLDELVQESLLTPAAIGKVAWREDYRIVKRRTQQMDVVTGEPATAVFEEPEVKFRGPKLQLVDLANFVIYPLSARDVESSYLVGDRFRLSRDEILRRVKQGTYDSDAADRVLAGTAETEDSSSQDDEETSEMDREGLGATDAEFYPFWEIITGYDADGDGLNEDCVFVVDATNGVVVRKARFPYYHGRRYYVPFSGLDRPRRFFGRSSSQLLEHMQLALNRISNQRADAITLAMCKPFKRRRQSTGPDDFEFFPGAQILVDAVDDIEEMNINPIVPGADIEQMYLNYAERVSGINDISSARGSEEEKTAREVSIVNSEGGIRFGDLIRRLQRAFIEVTRQVVGLCYQFEDDTTLALFKLQREDLLIPWEFSSHGNTATANKLQQRQEAQFLYQVLSNNALVLQDPVRAWRVTRDLLVAFDRDNVEDFIGTEEEIDQMAQANGQGAIMEILQGVAGLLGIPAELMMEAAQEVQGQMMEGGNAPGAGPGGRDLAAPGRSLGAGQGMGPQSAGGPQGATLGPPANRGAL